MTADSQLSSDLSQAVLACFWIWTSKGALTSRLELRTARTAVVGLSYAGLPMAVALASAGYRVIRFDVDGARVAAIVADRSSVSNVSDDEIRRLCQANRLD